MCYSCRIKNVRRLLEDVFAKNIKGVLAVATIYEIAD